MKNYIKILSLLFFFIALFTPELSAQKPPTNDEEFEKAHKRRIRQEQLYGVYIPKDLTEAFIELNRKIDKESQEKFKSLSEKDAEKKLYFSLGRWIIHNWGFYGGSRLSKYMNDQFGIYHPEKMASFIIIAYHRNLRRTPLEIKQLVEYFMEMKTKEEQARKKKGTVIFEEKKKRNN